MAKKRFQYQANFPPLVEFTGVPVSVDSCGLALPNKPMPPRSFAFAAIAAATFSAYDFTSVAAEIVPVESWVQPLAQPLAREHWPLGDELFSDPKGLAAEIVGVESWLQQGELPALRARGIPWFQISEDISPFAAPLLAEGWRPEMETPIWRKSRREFQTPILWFDYAVGAIVGSGPVILELKAIFHLTQGLKSAFHRTQETKVKF